MESADKIQNDRLLAITNALLGEVKYSQAKLITSDSKAHRLEKLNLLKAASEYFKKMLGSLIESRKRDDSNKLLCEDLSHRLD